MGSAAFNSLMTDTVVIEPATGRDLYGEPLYGAPVSYLARVLYRSRAVRSTVADVSAARGVVWIAGQPAVSLDARVTLPDGSKPPILMIEAPTDQVGVHHTKLTFGWSGPNVNPR